MRRRVTRSRDFTRVPQIPTPHATVPNVASNRQHVKDRNLDNLGAASIACMRCPNTYGTFPISSGVVKNKMPRKDVCGTDITSI